MAGHGLSKERACAAAGLSRAAAVNAILSMDFMSDILYNGRRFRTFNVLDDGVVLGAYLFDNLDQVRRVTAEWLRTYNGERPHDSLGDQTPAEYREAFEAGVSTLLTLLHPVHPLLQLASFRECGIHPSLHPVLALPRFHDDSHLLGR